MNPSQSLLLLKAAGRVSHGGGRRVQVDGPEYGLLRDWIAAGALCDVEAKENALAELRVAPLMQTAGEGDESI